MIRKISRPMLAIALAFGMFAAFSTSSHAALSSAERPATAAAQSQTAAVEASASQDIAAEAPVPTKATSTTAAPVATAIEQPRKPTVPKAKPRIASRFGYPCH